MNRLSRAKELWEFFKARKKWYLAVIITILVLVGAILVISQGSAAAPFIYAIF